MPVWAGCWREGVMRVEQSVLFQKTLNVDNERTERKLARSPCSNPADLSYRCITREECRMVWRDVRLEYQLEGYISNAGKAYGV